jgi:chemotaxis protein CheX
VLLDPFCPRMAATSPITDTLIQDSIVQAVGNVCRIMLRQEAHFVERSVDTSQHNFGAELHIFGSVGFAGEANGIVYLCIPDDFAKNAASRILGMSSSEIEMHGDEVIKDVIGEITNMTVGGFKNALCDLGFPCKLTLPTIVRGDNLAVAALKSAARHIFHFDCDGHRLITDIQLKVD